MAGLGSIADVTFADVTFGQRCFVKLPGLNGKSLKKEQKVNIVCSGSLKWLISSGAS